MGVYKHPRALYTKLTHSLIYFVATVKLEEKHVRNTMQRKLWKLLLIHIASQLIQLGNTKRANL